jgi:hypothetical protein
MRNLGTWALIALTLLFVSCGFYRQVYYDPNESSDEYPSYYPYPSYYYEWGWPDEYGFYGGFSGEDFDGEDFDGEDAE